MPSDGVYRYFNWDGYCVAKSCETEGRVALFGAGLSVLLSYRLLVIQMWAWLGSEARKGRRPSLPNVYMRVGRTDHPAVFINLSGASSSSPHPELHIKAVHEKVSTCQINGHSNLDYVR